jgi:hypothetical protein
MNGKNWNEIGKYQVDNFFTQTEDETKEELKNILKLYNSDVYEQFLDDPKCAECGEVAS